MDVRDYYEDLITTGKLRVVEEVEYLSDGGCSNCGNTIYSDAGIERPNAGWFCPGCGNKIKRA